MLFLLYPVHPRAYHRALVEMVLWFMAEGVDVSVMVRYIGFADATIARWLTPAGAHSTRLHDILFGFSKNILTAFIERLNSLLTRKTWSLPPSDQQHVQWWRAYYHFIRAYESLRDVCSVADLLAKPLLR